MQLFFFSFVVHLFTRFYILNFLSEGQMQEMCFVKYLNFFHFFLFLFTLVPYCAHFGKPSQFQQMHIINLHNFIQMIFPYLTRMNFRIGGTRKGYYRFCKVAISIIKREKKIEGSNYGEHNHRLKN